MSFFCKKIAVLLPVLFAYSVQAREPAYDADDQYVEQHVRGWLVRVNKKLSADEYRKLRADTLELLDEHLYRITRVVPANALAKLRKVPIWVELAHPKHPCMCYHPSKEWLRQNGMNPHKAGAVELANCKNFLKWTGAQPWMVLHELAHGYHHQVLGFDNPAVRDCYQAAKDGKLYDKVLHVSGRKQKHYALTNPQEYFAEMSEAYFGTNDFYPFVRAELKETDPRMYALLEKVWGVRK
jgi:hypothetical protein